MCARSAIYAILIAVAFLFLVATGTARAHALLVRSSPLEGAVLDREPTVIRLWFSEDLNPGLSRAVVWDRNRQNVAVTEMVKHNRQLVVRLEPNPPKGSYLVLWTSVSSDDGHVLKGAFVFSIGRMGPLPPAPSSGGVSSEEFPPNLEQAVSILARAISLLSSGFWLGLALFTAVVRHAAGDHWAATDFQQRYDRRAWRTMPLVLTTLLMAGVVEVGIQAHSLAGTWTSAFSGGTLKALLLQTEYGHLWLAGEIVALVALTVTILSASRGFRAALASPKARVSHANPLSSSSGDSFPWLLLLVLAVVHSYVSAASGHASTVNFNHTGTGMFTVPVALDWLHVLATGAWVGGILSIAIVLLPAIRRTSVNEVLSALDILDRFSPFAYASVLALALTGAFNGTVHVPSWNAFFNAVYGRTLTVKMLLVGLMILISAFTVGVVRPQLRRLLLASGSSTSDVVLLQGVLTRWLRTSALLGCGVFLATAVLSAYPVPATFGAHGGPLILRQQRNGLRVSLQLQPGRAGQNVFTVTLRHRRGPLRLADVHLLNTMLDMNMGTQYLTLKPAAPGTFTIPVDIPMGGHWRLEVVIRLPHRLSLVRVYFKTLLGQ